MGEKVESNLASVKRRRKKKRIVLVPIQQTRCWQCAHLERIKVLDSNGEIVEAYRCIQNLRLPARLPPHFAEKCANFKRKEEEHG